METRPRHSIADLARLTGVTPRTVRYYIAQGLLPGANDAGQGAWYDERHLARLRLIRRLQAQHLPLAEIRTRLDELSDDEVGELLVAEPDQATPSQTSALEYVRGVLGTPRREEPRFAIPQPRQVRPLAPSRAPRAKGMIPRFAGPVRMFRTDDSKASDEATGTAEASEPLAMFALPVAPAAAPTPPATSASRSQWDRIGLTPDIELHVRRPLSRLDNRRVERLITIARQLLKVDTP